VPGHNGEYNTACLFLPDNDYIVGNHAAFQVNVRTLQLNFMIVWHCHWENVCCLASKAWYWISIQWNPLVDKNLLIWLYGGKLCC
jgi:hypothetical protein